MDPLSTRTPVAEVDDEAVVPLPFLVRPLVPEMDALIVARVREVDPSVLTVIVGVPPSSVRVFAPVPVKTQLEAVAPVPVSPKMRFPIVRGPPSVTVEVPLMSRVLKLAVAPLPPATIPPAQFAVTASLQVPLAVPLEIWLHVPSAALATGNMDNMARSNGTDFAFDKFNGIRRRREAGRFTP